jgi:hypothetical protein
MFLKKGISLFLSDSHKLLFNIFSNLTEAKNLLSSPKSKIAEISCYYLNHTDTSYSDIIEKSKEILENYYIKEINLIMPLVNKLLIKFYNESVVKIKIEQSTLDVIVEKLKNGNLSINSGSYEETKKIIDNINNSKILINDIIINIIEKFNNSIGILDNGFFETQKSIDDNNEAFSKIVEEAISISKIFDNNSLIDKTFDNIMIYFREQFMILLKNMEISKRQNFPLKENILSNSSFSQEKMNTIDDSFKNGKKNIINKKKRK